MSPRGVVSTVFVALLGSAVASQAYMWDSCGTRYDRLKTTSLTFKAEPSLQAGSVATITTTGNADLHGPVDTGAWQVRVYENDRAHSIYTDVGDLMTALHWNDAKHTTYTLSVSFTLPKPQGVANFTASLSATDQSKATYCCLEVKYAYTAAGFVAAAEEPAALPAPEAAVQQVGDVDCGGGYSCADGQTCCSTATGGVACCPTPNATCCSDHSHCCPSTYPICDLTRGTCSKGGPMTEQSPLLTRAPAMLAPVPALKDGPHFWSCGGSGDILKNLQIKLDPPAPVKGKPVTISASGTVGESVSGGTVHYKAALDGIQLISKTDQLCDLLKKAGKACPVAAGPLSLGITVNIPSWAPGGNYSATATAVDQSSKELTCLQGWFVLS